MTPSSRKERKKHQRQPDRPDPRPGRRVWLCFWLLSCLLLLERGDAQLFQTVTLVDPPLNCALTPGWAWDVPLGKLVSGEPFAEMNWVLYGAVSAAIIASLTCRFAAALGAAGGLAALAGWSLGMAPGDLIPGLLLLLINRVRRWEFRSGAGRTAALLAWMVLCAGGTCDFGLLWLYGFLGVAPGMMAAGDRRWNSREIVTLILAVGGLVALASSYRWGVLPAMLRPVSWIWLRPDPSLLPSTAFALANPESWISHALLLVVFLFGWWRLLRSNLDQLGMATVLLLSCLGLGCGRFLWLSSVALVLQQPGVPPVARPLLALRLEKLLVAGCLTIAAVRGVSSVPGLVSDVQSHLVDPGTWGIAGPAMLKNLDRSGDWQTQHLRTKYPLIINDRWDVFGDIYPLYAGVVRDIAEARNDSYLRTDFQWGGYKRWLKSWSPVLFVADSDDLDAIRRLSLSPDWKIAGIDARRTVFVPPDDPQALRIVQRASGTLLRLEWPGLSGTPLDENVVVTSRPADFLRVAAVLAAIRMPYAALRVLRTGPDPHNLALEAGAYLELAHRVQRHAGTPSLLDQFRAISRIRKYNRRLLTDAAVRARLTAGLAGLEQALPAQESLENTSPDHLAQAGVSADEIQIRQALARGDAAECAALLKRLDGPLASYYAVLAAGEDASPAQLLERLRSMLAAPGMPERLQGEAWFYLGCLANEVGDPLTAAESFARSDKIDPASPFAPLRSLYLRQITGS